MRDLAFAFRRCLETPIFSLGVVSILAVGIGTTSAMVSVLDALMYRTIDLPSPDTLIGVQMVNAQGVRRNTPLAMLEQLPTTELGVSGWCGYSGGAIDPTEAGGRSMSAAVEFVTGDCRRVLGIVPALGRWIAESEAPLRGPGHPVAVISHEYWMRMFAGDPDVLGRTLRIHDGSVTVIGVMPAGGSGLQRDLRPDLIVPVNSYRPMSSVQLLIGRLEPAETLELVRTRIRNAWPSVTKPVLPSGEGASAPQSPSDFVPDVLPLASGVSLLRRLYAAPVSAIAALAAVLLLLTCVNVGGLLVSRTMARRADIGIMRALGASSYRLARSAFVESLVVAVAGAAAAIPVAYAVADAFSTLLPRGLMPWTITLTPDSRIVSAIAVTSIVLAGVISAPPIWLSTRFAPLLHGDRTAAPRTSRWGDALLIAQLATTVILLFACGVLLRSFNALTSADRGYRHTNVLSVRLSPQPGGHRDLDQSVYYRELVDRLALLPGVQSVGFARYFGTLITTPPLQPVTFADDDRVMTTAFMEYVSPRFFETVGIPLLRGRDVAWSDTATTRAVVIVSEGLARALAPDGNAVGKVIRYGSAGAGVALEIVGVVGDASLGDLRDRSVRVAYAPAVQAKQATLATLQIRADGDLLALARPTGEIVRGYSREYVSLAVPIDEHFANASVPERMAATASSVAAAVGLLLACLGIYASLAQAVYRRTREIGIRIAVGATRADVSRLVVFKAAALILAGLVVGIPVAVGAASVLRSLLYGVTTTDPVALVACAVLLSGTGLIASLGPARRAIRLEPATALRAE